MKTTTTQERSWRDSDHEMWTLTGAGPDGKPVQMSGMSSDILRRQSDGKWLIIVDNPWGTAILA